MAKAKATVELARPKALEKLYSKVIGLIGKKCWKAGFSYAGQLRLHFGARIPYASPKMAGKKKGEWMFGTCGTPWILVTPHGSVSSMEADEDELEQRIKELENAKVTGFGISVPDHALLLTFTGQRCLYVVPTSDDDQWDVPYWELFLPGDLFIEFGPDGRWTCARSNVTAS
jgi:hypothetical protein